MLRVINVREYKLGKLPGISLLCPELLLSMSLAEDYSCTFPKHCLQVWQPPEKHSHKVMEGNGAKKCEDSDSFMSTCSHSQEMWFDNTSKLFSF